MSLILKEKKCPCPHLSLQLLSHLPFTSEFVDYAVCCLRLQLFSCNSVLNPLQSCFRFWKSSAMAVASLQPFPSWRVNQSSILVLLDLLTASGRVTLLFFLNLLSFNTCDTPILVLLFLSLLCQRVLYSVFLVPHPTFFRGSTASVLCPLSLQHTLPVGSLAHKRRYRH